MKPLELTEEECDEIRAFLQIRRALRYGNITIIIKDGRILDVVTETRVRFADLLEKIPA